MIREKRDAVQQNRYSAMIQDIYDESSIWVTKENVDKRINTRLFDTIATTGFVAKSSQYWRYMAVPLKVDHRIKHSRKSLQVSDGKYYKVSPSAMFLNPMENAHM